MHLEPGVLAHRLTMAGLEVTSLEAAEDDYVFEIEVTPNRPDLLSVVGIAREAAAITDRKLLQKAANLTGKQAGRADVKFNIEIEDKKDCPLYTAKIIRGVTVGPSPAWLKKRLELIGCRSVNNIVDITNYILFTYGEPLHAFDLDKLKGNTIGIRRARNNEKIVAINGVEYTLNREVLVIADARGAVAIAGVMGGKDAEVTQSTKNVFLEAAVFNPVVIRRGRQQLGIQSDSSYRFERGIDFNIVEPSSWQAVSFMQENAGQCVLAKTSPVPRAQTIEIDLSVARACKILGITIEASRLKNVLTSLGFTVKAGPKHILKVKVPSHRLDVKLEVDLIEEIARIFGYERLPASSPKVLPRPNPADTRDIISLIKDILAGLGLNEVITNSLIDSDFLRGVVRQREGEPIRILNPLNKEQEILRPTLIPSLLRCVAHNLNQKQGYINIFEVAKAFSCCGSQYLEEPVLGMALCGTRSLLLEQGLIKDEAGLLHIKGMVEALFERLGIREYHFEASAASQEIAIYVKKEKAGAMSQVSTEALANADIKNKDVFAAEIILDKVISGANLQKRFSSLPIYPAISRDISFVLKEDIKINEIIGALEEQGRPLLKEIRVSDYYKGKQIPAGFRSLTISCLYRLDERTLTDSEVNPVHSALVAVLTDKFGAKIR